MIAIGARVKITAGLWQGRTGRVRDLTRVGFREPCIHVVDLDTPCAMSGPYQLIEDGQLEEITPEAP